MPLARRSVPPRAIGATLVLALVVGACSPGFDPTAPCTSDGRAPGAYPALEARVPRDLGGSAPTRVDSGRNCTPAALGSLLAHGVTELRFAGSTWETGTSSGVTIALFEAPGLRADWVHEFFKIGAENARNTEGIEASTEEVDGQPQYRVDALNGEGFQTVIDWQDGDVVRVVLVSSFIRQVQTKDRHEATVRDALATARENASGAPE
jgi:hypothetical protein